MSVKKKVLIGIVLLSSVAFWLCLLRIFRFESYVTYGMISLLIIIGSTLLLFRGFEYRIERKWGILLIPFAISSVLIPYPYNVGFILLTISFLLVAVLPRVWLWLGFAVSGLLLTIQAAGMSIYHLLIPSGHSAVIMSYLVYPLSKIFGFVTSFQGGTVFIQKGGDVFSFPTTWDTLGVYPFILVFLPVLTYLLITSETLNSAVRRAVGLIVLSVVYLLVRYVLLLHVYFSADLGVEALSKFATIFFSSLWLFITFIPFVVLILLIYTYSAEIEFPQFTFDKRGAAISAVLFVSAFLLCGSVFFHEHGVQKQGRVLVDEIHSTWEPSSLILDKYWYGSESTYNAYSMVEWFKVAFDVDRVMSPAYLDWVPGETISKVGPDVVSEEITAEMLQNYDILILKTPTMYTEREVAAIVDFIRNGGGLFVIGDHSNFCGTSTSLNQITGPFGITFEFDSVNNAEGRLSIYNRGEITHPCAKYMPRFDFLTSCSVKAPMAVGRVIPGYGLSAEPGEYASTGFFRETRRDLPVLATDRQWGLFHQCVAAECGKGRIVAFADSTTISNFRIFFGGSDQMAIGSMEWLNYSNRFPYARKLFAVGGLVFAAVGVFLFGNIEKKKRIGALLIVVCMMGLGSSLAVAAFSPKVHDTIPVKYYDWENTVCFDGDHSVEIINSGDHEGEYTVFLIWTQRLGLVPTVEYSLEECAEKGKTIIIVDPLVKNFSQEDIELLKEHVKKGGTVLMMVDSVRVLGLNLLAEFGLEIEEIMKPQDATEEEAQGPLLPWGPSVKGGEALKTIGERVIIARVSYGDGYFVLCTVSNAFRDGFNGQPGYMGYNGTDPDALEENQKEITWEIYNLEFEIFEEMLQ